MKKPPKTGVLKATPAVGDPAEKRKQNQYNLLRQIISDAVACEAKVGNEVTLDEKASEFYEANAGLFDAVRQDHKAMARSLKRKLAVARHVEKHRLRAVQGDRAALEYLFHLARTAAYALEYSAQDHHSLIKDFAAKQVEWPLILSPFPKVQAVNMQHFASLMVGSKGAFPVDLYALAKVPKNQSAARSWVADLATMVLQLYVHFFHEILLHGMLGRLIELSAIEGNNPSNCTWSTPLVVEALNLGKLTKSEESQKAWLEFALKVAEEEAGGELARHPRLKADGAGRAMSKRSFKDEQTDLKKRVKTPIRLAEGAIKQAIKNNLGSLAPLD